MGNSYFEDLEIDKLKKAAKEWASPEGGYSALRKLTIYKPNEDRIDPNDKERQYVFVAVYSTEDKSEESRFLSWGWPTCIHIQRFLPRFYKEGTRGSNWFLNWSWHPVSETEPWDFNSFIDSEDYVTLFSSDQTEAQNETEGLEAERKHLEEIREAEEEKARKDRDPLGGEDLYPHEVLMLIQNAKPEVDKLWEGMLSIQKAKLTDRHSDSRDSYKEAALTYLEQPGTNYELITKEILNDGHLYYFGPPDKPLDKGHYKRNFIGKLYQLLINQRFPKELPEPRKAPRRYGVKKLVGLHEK